MKNPNKKFSYRVASFLTLQIDVDQPDFKEQRITVEIPMIFRSPRLLVNGAVIKKSANGYLIHSDSGTETTIELKRNFFDPVPKMKINGKPVLISRKFTEWEYAWFVILIGLTLPQENPPGAGLVGVIANCSRRQAASNHLPPAGYSG
jgi:hypothetical protein